MQNKVSWRMMTNECLSQTGTRDAVSYTSTGNVSIEQCKSECLFKDDCSAIEWAQNPLGLIHTNRLCQYSQLTNSMRSVKECLDWVKSTDPAAEYFSYTHGQDFHCSPCPPTYTGETEELIVYQTNGPNVWKILGPGIDIET